MSKIESSTDFKYTKVPIKDNEKAPEIVLTYGYGIRHVQLVIFFLCLSISFVSRGHLGVTIVAMTRQQDNVRNSTYLNITKESNVTEQEWTVYRIYEWSKPIQEMVLSAFFLGYLLMMFPIGMVCQRWGGKVPLQISMLINGIVSILTPWIALWGGWKAVCACRMIQGLSQSGTFPGIQTLVTQWVPDSERATLASYVYAGTTVGNVVGFQIGGVLSAYWGWPVTFWAVGVFCLLTCALLTVFGEHSPMVHKKISDEEKNFILGSRNRETQNKRAPFKAILTSKPVWGNFTTHVGSGVAYVFFLTQVPSYIHYILNIDVKSSGLLTSLPYLGSFFTSMSYGIISDYLTNRKIVSIKNARRIFNSLSQVGIGSAIICASYATSTTAAVVCLVVAMSCQMAIHTGWMVNHIDLAPNYTGTMMSIGSTLMNIFILLLPVMVSNIVVDVKNVFQWRIMIFLIAGIAFVTNLVFVLLISTDLQPWNEGNFTEKKSLASETVKEKEKEENIVNKTQNI